MTDWLSASIKMQKQMLAAQKETLDAGRKMIGMGDQFVKMQEVGRQMAEANVAAFNAWAKMWGIR